MNCNHCKSDCCKAGLSRTGIQRYRCKSCRKYFQESYRQHARSHGTNESIVKLLTEGIAIRGIARILMISITTVTSRIRTIAARTLRPKPGGRCRVVEIDELWTFIGKKECGAWITYALNRDTRDVIDFTVGLRTKDNLSSVTSAALSMNPLKICTDGLSTYRALVPSNIHRVGLPHTRRIERFNLNLRTHLKRLARKTICFSKSADMLTNCLRIYFWRKPGIV